MTTFLWKLPPSVPLSPTPSPIAPGEVDHVAEALARVTEQFKNSPNFLALLTALVTPAQALEDALQQLLLDRAVDTAEGAQLDAIGVIVGQARVGLSDDDYRRYIRARIATNRSKGSLGDLYRIARLVLDTDGVTLWAEQSGVAAIIFHVGVLPVDDSLASILLSFLYAAKDAGVRLLVEYITGDDADSFSTALYATGAAISIGASIITVDSTAGFPVSGQLDLEFGLAAADVATYTGITAATFTGVSGVAHNHPVGCEVTLKDAPGKGFGDDSDATAGGLLASVLELTS